jgi:hypothetical protein
MPTPFDMRDDDTSMQLRIISVAALALMASALSTLAEPVDPAQAIAQKFSEASDPKPAAKPERPSLDYEMDMLRRARAEELERENQDAQRPLTKIAQPAPAVAQAPVSPINLPPPGATTTGHTTQPAAPQPTLAAKPVETAVNPMSAPPPAPPSDTKAGGESGGSGDLRVTVLLVLGTDVNEAALAPKPDPIICLDQRCWISNGLEAPARPLPRSEAVALKSSAGATSDSCSGKSACVFRDVAISSDAQIQVVELGDSRGVASNPYSIAADASCRKDDGALVCDNALVTHEFRIWIVPEPTAQTIGAAALEDAVAEGLPSEDAPPANDK